MILLCMGPKTPNNGQHGMLRLWAFSNLLHSFDFFYFLSVFVRALDVLRSSACYTHTTVCRADWRFAAGRFICRLIWEFTRCCHGLQLFDVFVVYSGGGLTLPCVYHSCYSLMAAVDGDGFAYLLLMILMWKIKMLDKMKLNAHKCWRGQT